MIFPEFFYWYPITRVAFSSSGYGILVDLADVQILAHMFRGGFAC